MKFEFKTKFDLGQEVEYNIALPSYCKVCNNIISKQELGTWRCNTCNIWCENKTEKITKVGKIHNIFINFGSIHIQKFMNDPPKNN